MSEGLQQPEKEDFTELNPNELRRRLDHVLNSGTLSDLEALFDAGVDINQEDWEGRTAIQMLAVRGSKEGVEMMLSRGADINHVYMYQGRLPKTALDASRETKQKEIEELLLTHGAKTGKEVQGE
jgi:ankyrin repeat protein